MDMKITQAILDELTEQAKASPRHRAWFAITYSQTSEDFGNGCVFKG